MKNVLFQLPDVYFQRKKLNKNKRYIIEFIHNDFISDSNSSDDFKAFFVLEFK